MGKVTISTLDKMKAADEKFVCITAYDATFARMISEAGAETILVGDSLGMVMQDHQTTVPVSMINMVYHTQCVAKANQNSLLVADLPYMAYATEEQALQNSAKLMQAGANMIKVEGGEWLCSSINKLSERGIPVCGHLGLTPQSVDALGGYKIQGRDKQSVFWSKWELE